MLSFDPRRLPVEMFVIADVRVKQLDRRSICQKLKISTPHTDSYCMILKKGWLNVVGVVGVPSPAE